MTETWRDEGQLLFTLIISKQQEKKQKENKILLIYGTAELPESSVLH